MPDGLSAQWPLLPELMEAFGVVNLVKPGYEADDILGTLAEEAKRQGIGSVVVTGDRDAMQIVDDDIWVMSTGRGVTDVKIYTPAAVLERFGVTPAQIPDYIGLKGDTSDNIPGVPGIGEKTAAQLLQQFGSIDEMYTRLDEVKSEKRRALLQEHEADARLSLQLATMVCDVPLEHDLVEIVTTCGYRLPVESVAAVFERFEFRNLRRRLEEIAGEAPAPAAAPAAVSGSLVRLAAEPDVGPVAALLEKGEAAVAFEPRGEGRAGSPWRRTPAATPAWWRRPTRAGPARSGCSPPTPWCTTPRRSPGSCTLRQGRRSTPPSPPTCSRRSGRRRSARCSRSPAPTTARSWWKARRPRPPRPRAPPSRGAWPSRSGRASSSSASSGCSARSSSRSCACWPRWRPPGSRWTRTGSARSRRACATASTSSPTPSIARPASRSPSARRNSSQTCSSSASAWTRAGRARPGTRPTPGSCAGSGTSTPSCRWSRSGASSPSCSTRTSSRFRPGSTRSPAGSTPPSTSWWRPPAGSRAPTPTCRTSRCAPTWGRDPRLLRRRGGLQAARRRLLADRAAAHGVALARAGAARRVPPRRGRAPRHRRRRRRHPRGGGHQAAARARQGDQLRHHVRALRVRPLGAGRDPRGRGARPSSTRTSPSTPR